MKKLVELCMLHLFSEGDLYGYALLQKLYPIFPDIQESALYTILRGLHKEGCLETYRGEKSGGPPRKYYRMTEKGRERYKEILTEWKQLNEELKKIGIF